MSGLGRWWLKEAYTSRCYLWPLWPLAALYRCLMSCRAWCYRHGFLRTTTFPVPIWVIGNLTLGGTGKTALLIHLLRYCQAKGLKPGVVSCGYGGQSSVVPRLVTAQDSAELVGDEAVLILRKTGCPIVVGSDRVAAVQHLLSQHDCDVVLSDDGLQHLAMGRSMEICVLDGDRGLGNGWCLPAGPLRESPARRDTVDVVVCHGDDPSHPYRMQRVLHTVIGLHDSSTRRLIDSWSGQSIYLLTAIGNPDRLLSALQVRGLVVDPCCLPDHAPIPVGLLHDLSAKRPVLVTEKDATKIMPTPELSNIWVIEENIQLSDQLERFFEKMCYTLKEADQSKGVSHGV